MRIMALLLTGMAACSSQSGAPGGAGVCLQRVEGSNDGPAYVVLDRNVPNLESCAVQLEGARMVGGQSTSGLYNGHHIFATEDQITSSRQLEGTRIRVFEAEDRRKIQSGLRTLIELEDPTAAPAK